MNEEAHALPVEVVVPVYNAPDDLARCVESVLAHTRGDYRLVLIDDASPDPRIAAYFDAMERRALPHVTLLRNERNLGFTGTANRGMTRSRADVVLLNSDAVVTEGWLDTLTRAARSSPHIGTATPFSNNAEICSFPRFCENNVWPQGADPEPVRRALAASAVPTYPELPTGVGFCFFVKRTLLDAIGGFDPAFGAGYGEENDLCLRGFAVGYRNILVDDAFVLHTGGRSFEGRKEALGVRNLSLLVERHPHYLPMVQEYVTRDPLAPLREAALTELAIADGLRGVLHVIHHHGGGTETHARALVAALRSRWRHYVAIAVGDRWQVEEHRRDGRIVSHVFERAPDEPYDAFLRALCGTFAIGLVHLHNISASREGLLDAMPALGLPYGYTVHDVNFGCPTITFLDPAGRYCGAQTDVDACTRCLRAQPPFASVDVADWRSRHAALLAGAAFLVAPSRWSAQTLAKYFPGVEAKTTVVPHGLPAEPAADTRRMRLAVLMPDDDVPTVAVLGAIGPDKGARRLERLVELARERDARIRFVLIGYLDREHGPWQSDDARFTIHGRYAPDDLAALLHHYRASLVLYPSAGPETFSYTLSEAWRAGRPALVPPIGALAERVAPTDAGWVMEDAQWRDEAAMLDRLLALLGPANAAQLQRAAAAAAAMPHVSLDAMAAATAKLYERASRDVPRMPGFARDRVRDALGYRLWWPPERNASVNVDEASSRTNDVATAPADAPDLIASFARGAARVRQTALGRVLRRVTPEPLRAALKARLR